jgi:hypothetical protein
MGHRSIQERIWINTDSTLMSFKKYIEESSLETNSELKTLLQRKYDWLKTRGFVYDTSRGNNQGFEIMYTHSKTYDKVVIHAMVAGFILGLVEDRHFIMEAMVEH